MTRVALAATVNVRVFIIACTVPLPTILLNPSLRIAKTMGWVDCVEGGAVKFENVMLRLEPAGKFLLEVLWLKLTIVELVILRFVTVMVPPPLTVTAVSFDPLGKVTWNVSR